jgi:hypothetical protein
VDGLVSLEVTINDFMELVTSNLDMEYEAFNGVMVRVIRQLFHIDMLDELTFQGAAKYKIEKMKEYASNLREVKQVLFKDNEGLIVDSESVHPDEDDDKNAHAPDEEHRHEPGVDD